MFQFQLYKTTPEVQAKRSAWDEAVIKLNDKLDSLIRKYDASVPPVNELLDPNLKKEYGFKLYGIKPEEAVKVLPQVLEWLNDALKTSSMNFKDFQGKKLEYSLTSFKYENSTLTFSVSPALVPKKE